ncbi:MAG TPA: chemotaxis protein CheA [Acidobacteriaceae bacterium]
MRSTDEKHDRRLLVDQGLDDLATQMMVSGPESISSAALERLNVQATENGYQEVAETALAVARQIESEGARGNGSGEEWLRDSIAQLRQLIEEEAGKANQALLAEDRDPSPSSSSSFAHDPELLAGFVLESNEHLSAIQEQMLILEQSPTAVDVIHAVFRAFHSIKGIAGFLELHRVQTLAHEVETLLDLARNLKIPITPSLVDMVLESADSLSEEVALVDAGLNDREAPPIRDNSGLIEKLSNAAASAGSSIGTARGEAFAASDPTTAHAPDLQYAGRESVEILRAQPSLRLDSGQETGDPARSAARANVHVEIDSKRRSRGEVVKGSVRVETAKLDQLMDMVGEMVIAQSILAHNPLIASSQDAQMLGEISQLARLTGEVQRRAMSMRMMPIAPLFQKVARLVRDLSRRAGKHVIFESAGETTELDKSIAEELSDPLLHMVRNALDHGIEIPEERRAAGKDPVAKLRLTAQHQAGQILVEISDDGRGLNTEKIFKKALQNGLVAEGVSLSEAEIFQLIFEPGFSTADTITDISGRGVGMDVVRKHVEKLRGRIEITSAVGQGTTFVLHLPLTLAIIDGLVIVVGEHRYIIPVFSVREMFRPTREMLFTVQGREEMILMRGELLPLVRLHSRFAIEPRTTDPCAGLLVVAESGGKQFCLLVDELIGRQEIVIKSLGDIFQDCTGLAGCAILGDGRVGLILDLPGIFQGRRL